MCYLVKNQLKQRILSNLVHGGRVHSTYASFLPFYPPSPCTVIKFITMALLPLAAYVLCIVHSPMSHAVNQWNMFADIDFRFNKGTLIFFLPPFKFQFVAHDVTVTYQNKHKTA